MRRRGNSCQGSEEERLWVEKESKTSSINLYKTDIASGRRYELDGKHV
jgi:hypothetical protein